MATALQRRSICLATKIAIIEAVEKGQKKSDVAREFNIPKSTLSTILKNKNVLQQAHAGSKIAPTSKRFRLAAHQEVEEALFTWFKQARSMNVPISGPILKIKAKELALKLGRPDFSCSTGWLERFKSRHCIGFRKITGEEASVRDEMVLDWNSYQLPALLSEFCPDDIFNADETGLFWKCLPEKTMSLKGEKCSGGKKSKERVTVMVCANMTGSEKIPLLVLGKFAKPRCFKNARSIPVDYKANTKAWMTSDVFSSWLKKLDSKFLAEGRKVAMVVDNCPAHPNIQCELKATKLVFLPPNTTSKSQPCDQGIIQNLKVHYRKHLILQLISAIEGKQEFKFNLLDALYLLRLSWNTMSPSTISACFKHCGFVSPTCTEPTEHDNISNASNTSSSSCDSDIGTDQACELLTRLGTSVTMSDYASVDQDAITSEILTDDAIVESVLSVSQPQESEDDIEEGSEDANPVVTIREAQSSLDTLRVFLQQQQDADFNLFVKLDTHVKSFFNHTKQTLITDYVSVQDQ